MGAQININNFESPGQWDIPVANFYSNSIKFHTDRRKIQLAFMVWHLRPCAEIFCLHPKILYMRHNFYVANVVKVKRRQIVMSRCQRIDQNGSDHLQQYILLYVQICTPFLFFRIVGNFATRVSIQRCPWQLRILDWERRGPSRHSLGIAWSCVRPTWMQATHICVPERKRTCKVKKGGNEPIRKIRAPRNYQTCLPWRNETDKY